MVPWVEEGHCPIPLRLGGQGLPSVDRWTDATKNMTYSDADDKYSQFCFLEIIIFESQNHISRSLSLLLEGKSMDNGFQRSRGWDSYFQSLKEHVCKM